MLDVKVGDKVMIECYSGLGSGGPSKVTKITTETVGGKRNGSIVRGAKKKKVIWCGRQAFDAKDGGALNTPIMYYISHVIK